MDKSDVLKLSKNLYGAIPALLDDMPMGFAVMRVLIDEDGEPFDFVYEYANKMFASLQSISLEDLRQYSWGQLFPDEEMQVLGAYANVALNGGSRVIEETEEDGGRKLHINCYQPAYGYCALAVEEVPAASSAVVQEAQAVSAGAEENQMAQLLAEEELQKMEQLAQAAAGVQPEAPAAPVPPLEPLQAAPQQTASQEAAPQQAVSQQETASQQEAAAEEKPEAPAAPVPPLEPLQTAAQQTAPQQEAVSQQETAEEKPKAPAAPVPPLEPLQAAPQEAAPQQETAEEKPEAPAAPVPPLEPLQAAPQQTASQQAAPQQEAVSQQETAPQQAAAEEELITGGVTVSHIVEENKPAGYATIADLMASANQNQYQNEPADADEYAGEATPIGSIVNAYGGDSEGAWTEPGSSSDTVEFTEVEAVEEETPVNIESFVSEEDTTAFVAVGEEAEIEVQQPEQPPKPAEPVPELTADENSLMAKIKKVVESLNQFNEDKALEILTDLSNDSSLDASAVADVKKVKAMVECSMFEEAKELAQSLAAS